MQLHVAPQVLISEIQKEFNNNFPYLKIEFFSTNKKKGNEPTGQVLIPGNKTIGEIKTQIRESFVQLANKMKVKELEQLFAEQFALPVQVFRKSGTLWLETTMTDEWTLQQQNEHGRELSSVAKEKREKEDYDLTRDADH
jgi:hypothetical protein